VLFSLEVLRARKGDCLMLHYGPADAPRLVLIDGGPKGVYQPHLKPRLEQLRAARAAGKPLPVELLMVSHVDDDHIQGVLDLTRDLVTAQLNNEKGLVAVERFWHNSFENLIGHTPDELTAAVHGQFGAAATSGSPPADLAVESAEDEEVVTSSLKVLASIPQGAQLRADADRLGVPPNDDFGGGLIVAKKGAAPFEFDDALTFTVAGPMLPEVKALHKKHQAWLKELKKQGKTPEDVLSAYVDQSVPNLSSVVVLAEAGGKRVLLTGDARGDKILKGLELVGLLKKNGKLAVDVLKVPHHGSSNNLDKDFFERVVAAHYVFSGDGEHGNPERESLEMLLAARGDTGYAVHLTYPVAEIDAERKKDWEKEQAKEKKKKLTKPAQTVRPNWSPKDHSLAALFKANPAFAKTVRVVDAGQPHVIDLLEKVTF
jgi:beta-lactamase superfamily II metal-dependent hydrolase